ncbi:MAG TPA: VOC family protein [Saprospiraceae bacterium]|nr:VOC family protein [Saprospiraceae bacterium]
METNQFIKSFNHFAIEVKDLDRSIKFYKEILQFEMLPRPAFDFAGAWFDIGLGQQIHLIENKELQITFTGSRALHFAFAVTSLESVKSYLMEKGVEIAKDIKKRPDGVLQMFVKDPDGYFLEFTELFV